ncbi:MAG: ATP synthase F1 subunit delta [Defluviitaleaceae bacterium]|nr:ATP synthase F1 subunit delta [Defluviitaleaceae bacterium]
MAELVSRRYSEAFFDLALESGKIELFAEDARFVLDTLAHDAVDTESKLGEFLYHPQIAEESKISVVESALKGKVCDELVGLIVMIIRKQRERVLPSVLELFLQKVDEHNELAEVLVTSAVPIDEGRLEIIRGILSEKFGKKIVIKTSIDKELIGGFKILILGYSFDRTIKTSINELTASIS